MGTVTLSTEEYAEAVGDGSKAIGTSELVIALGSDSKKEQARKQLMAMDKLHAIPMLLRGLNNEDFYVRAGAFVLLKKLTGQLDEMGYDPAEENEVIRVQFIAKWEEWFAKNKEKFENE